MRSWVSLALDTLFPERCRLCMPADDAPPWVCARCIHMSPPPPARVCAACGADAPPTGAPHRGPIVQAATWYACDDRIGAAAALRMLKFDARRRLAAPLAALLRERIALPTPALLVPVPLHPAKLRRRGFNQAALLARHVARTNELPHDPTVLRRTRDTDPQAGLSRAARLANLGGAFAASPALHGRERVVLVDDVATTGATLAACAAALRAVGVRDVAAVVVARRVLLSPGPRTR